MKFIEDIDIRNKRVLIRVDYNIPIENGEIVNDFRIKRSLKTINYCIEKNASIVLISHMGRPEATSDLNLSLEPISWYLEDVLDMSIFFSDNCISDKSFMMSKMLKPQEILLLENLRFHKEEENNEDIFSKKLSKHADIYINDAFGTAHRSHASNVGITKYFKQKGFGFLMKEEIKYLKGSMDKSESPLLVIIGGAKISTKIELINNLLNRADIILIGGGMAFTFLKAMGHEIGQSLFEEEYLSLALDIINKAKENKVSLILPLDAVCAKDVNDPTTIEVKSIDSFMPDDIGLDIGPETCINFDIFISSSKTIVWNGPMGLFENIYFSTGTQAIASSLQIVSESKQAITIIGGGDTVRAIDDFNKDMKFTHISTGGGSSLEMLSGNKLPALESLGEK